MKRIKLTLVVLLIAAAVLAQGRAALARAESGMTLTFRGQDHFRYRFLWPADVAKPGQKLVELSAKKTGDVTIETPLGPAAGEVMDLLLPAGEVVATARLLRLTNHENVFVFQTETKREIAAPTGEFARPHFALPAIATPAGYRHVLNFAVEEFVTPIQRAIPTTGPVAMFSDGLEVLVMSPLDNFMAALQQPVRGEWRIGFEGLVENIPVNTVSMTILVAGHGVNATMMRWGRLIQAWHGHKPVDPYADVAMSRLGYWTDNGAYYYYRTEPGMNYEDTLLAIKAYADREKIPYGYFQLDSWWYPKAVIEDNSSHDRGGFLLWEPIPELFPSGLAAFRAKLGLPLVAHNRYCASESPYCQRYQCVFDNGDKKKGAYPIDPAFWDEIMDNAKRFGVEVYEQDWLYTHLAMIPWMRAGLHHAETWYDNMATAAEKRGLTMQLCMASPEFFLQQLRHNNVTHARVSHDYKGGLFKAFFWTPFHKASLFAAAVGIWPFKDNFQSTPGQSPQYNLIPEGNPYEEVLIASLSGGPVGPSDRIGFSDRELILRTCRSDGVLLKPDRPATPIDLMFLLSKTQLLGSRRPWTVSTESNHAIGQTVYLAAFNLWPQRLREPFVNLSELGLAGDRLAYNYRTGQAAVVKDRVRFGRMPHDQGFYYVLAPILSNGMAVIGETGKFITLSAKRFPVVKLENGLLELELEGVPGEAISVAIYSNHAPSVVEGSAAVEMKSDASSGLYTFSAVFPASGKLAVKLK